MGPQCGSLSFYTPRLETSRAAYFQGCISSALPAQPSQVMQMLSGLPVASLTSVPALLAEESSDGINPVSKSIFSGISLNIYYGGFFC